MQPLPCPPWSPLGCSSWLPPCFSPHTPTWPWTERLGIMFPVYSWSWRTLSRVNCLLSPWWNGCTRVAQLSVNCLDGCDKYLQQMPSCLSVRTLFIHSNNWTWMYKVWFMVWRPIVNKSRSWLPAWFWQTLVNQINRHRHQKHYQQCSCITLCKILHMFPAVSGPL